MRGLAVTIKAVFRVQCDGPCRGWLSWREGYVPGTDIKPSDQIVAPTAERACNWPDDHAARVAARNLGWTTGMRDGVREVQWQCPDEECGEL